MRFLPAGDAALLVELADLAHTLALYRAVQARPVAGVHELIPAARTLLVHYHPHAIARAALVAALRERADGADVGQSDAAPARVVHIPVHYRGEDLADVARLMASRRRKSSRATPPCPGRRRSRASHPASST